jgi:adhesin HecA-like repeat protein
VGGRIAGGRLRIKAGDVFIRSGGVVITAGRVVIRTGGIFIGTWRADLGSPDVHIDPGSARIRLAGPHAKAMGVAFSGEGIHIASVGVYRG